MQSLKIILQQGLIYCYVNKILLDLTTYSCFYNIGDILLLSVYFQQAKRLGSAIVLEKKEIKMLKIRLKRLGSKKNPHYRIIVINSTTKREGRPVEELGHYNPKTKEMKLDKATALDWISKDAKPTETVQYLINNCDDEGKLIYKQKTEKKLSKKALAKLEAEKEAQAAAAAAAAEAPAEEAAAE